MREERLLNMNGEVNENYIMEADPATEMVNKVSVRTKLAVIAACPCIVFIAGGIIVYFSVIDNASNYISPLSVAAAELEM